MRSITAPAPSPSSPNASEPWRQSGFGLYVHWPFCQAKCPYCDFNSHVAAHIDQARWARAYAAEIARAAAETEGRVLSSVFFGGGTPSLMLPETVEAVLAAVRAGWSLANDVEVTLEANPTSVEAAHFRAYRAAGVDRVSLGVQALNDADLRRLGRLHSAEEARAAVMLARETFDRVSFDLIYARQDQTLSQWQDELTQAIEMSAGHLSLYQLTIEPGTAFGDRHRLGRLAGLPDDERAADLFLSTQEITRSSGLPAYEISNHAVPGQESVHNLIYWQGGDYVGVGPGAHGRLTFAGRRWATETHVNPSAWLSAVEERGRGELPRQELSETERRQERLMMGLRLAQGIHIGSIEAAGLDPQVVTGLQASGHIELVNGCLRTTGDGRLVLNALLREML